MACSCVGMRLRLLLWAAVFGMGWATPALAAETAEKKPSHVEYTLALLGGYGAGNKYEYDDWNRYGGALGGRGGLTLSMPKLYFGLSFVHFAGTTRSESQKVFTNTLDAEFGYDVQLLQNRLLIRPQLTLGVAQPVTVQPDNASYMLGFHWAPGLLVGVRVAPLLISAEYRHDMIPNGWPSANTALLGFGLML